MQPQESPAALVEAGWEAVSAGAWSEAEIHFSAACAEDDVPEALEGLGLVALYLDEEAASVSAYRRAYRLYRERADPAGAARAATALALAEYTHGGDVALVRGWLGRARRLLDGRQDSPEYAWLRQWEADTALLVDRDAAGASTAAAEAVALARALGDRDLEMLAMALQGLALVSLGDVDTGMPLLDESCAAALGGEISDGDVQVTTYCYAIYGCERARDYERGWHWTEHARAEALRRGYRFGLAVCRTHYAELLLASGAWARAEVELEGAIAHLDRHNQAWAADAVSTLAELRRLQGKVTEAQQLLDRTERAPLRTLTGPSFLVSRAAMALDAGEPERAAGLVDRFLRQLPESDRAGRVNALRLQVAALCAAGRPSAAAAACAELTGTAAGLKSAAVGGWAAAARGAVAVAQADVPEAVRQLEDAVDQLTRAQLPYDVAKARVDLARLYAATGDPTQARQEAAVAADVFRDLGAAPDLVHAERVLAECDQPTDTTLTTSPSDPTLSPREVEVLRLLAVGHSNEELATRLVLSSRTVERHVSNIYLKLGLRGPAARAGAAAYAHRTGLVPDRSAIT